MSALAGLAMLGVALAASKDSPLKKALKASDSFPKNVKPIAKFMNESLWEAGFDEGLLFMDPETGSISYGDGYVDLFKRLGGCSPQISMSALMAEDDLQVFSNTVFDEDGQMNLDIAAKFIRETVGDTDRQDLIEEAAGTWEVIVEETALEMDEASDLLDRYAELRDAACGSQLSGSR